MIAIIENFSHFAIRFASRSLSKEFKVVSLSIIVVTRDHSDYILQCLASIENEFGKGQSLFIVDVGSHDDSMSKILSFLENTLLDVRLITLGREITPLGAIKSLISLIETEFVSIISGDDYFLEGYASTARSLISGLEPTFAIHFSHKIVDANCNYLGRRTPKWSSSFRNNRLRLLYSNPGTAPGCILPWQILVTRCLKNDEFDTLIEDYYFTCKLISQVSFLSQGGDLVAYRRHKKSLSSRTDDYNYIFSLGICIRESWKIATNIFEKGLSLTLFIRWGRHISLKNFPILIKGFTHSEQNGGMLKLLREQGEKEKFCGQKD